MVARGAGEVVLQTEHLKHSKFTALKEKFLFEPVVVETLGVFGSEAHEFLHELGSRIT